MDCLWVVGINPKLRIRCVTVTCPSQLSVASSMYQGAGKGEYQCLYNSALEGMEARYRQDTTIKIIFCRGLALHILIFLKVRFFLLLRFLSINSLTQSFLQILQQQQATGLI